jgi:DNA-directed RNA polymerase specialized sigma subunit
MAHYVKNSDLRNEIIRCKEKDEISREAIEMFQLMARKFSDKLTYIYEEDREDCIAFGVMDCYQYWRGYNPEKSQNAFAYFTQIIKNGFAKGWRKLYGNMPKSKKISISNDKLYNINI